MIDWNEISPEDTTFDVDAEGIQELANALMFPLKVFGPEGRLLFTHPVSLREEFYRQLMTLPDPEPQLMKILRSRLKEEVGRRRQQAPGSIEKRVQLMQSTQTLNG